MLRAVWFDAGPAQPGQLLLFCHHLVVERGFLAHPAARPDRCLEQARAGRQPELEPVGTSFRAWAEHQCAQACDRTGELASWTKILDPPAPLLAADGLDPAVDLVDTSRTVTIRLDVDETRPC